MRSEKKRTPSRRSAAPAREPAPLGPGLHGAFIELAAEGSYRVRTIAGLHLRAELAPGVSPALAMECLRAGRMVIVVDSPRGPAIAGALQTAPAIEKDADGVVAVDAREIRLRAERSILIEAGPVTIRGDESGALRMEGDRLVLDMPALVRVLSARMEIP
jgi:hypothetical protein